MASACALAMFSGKNIYNFAILENLRIFQNCLFMGGVVKGSGRCNAGFLRKHLRGGLTPSVIACGDATFPKGTAFGGEGKDHGIAKGVPLGELARRKP